MEIIVNTAQARSEAINAIRQLTSAQPVHIVTIKPFKFTRSQQANRYYWAALIKLCSDETGYTSEEMHEYFRRKFLTPEVKEVLGEPTEIYPSTTKLTTKEFAEYMDKITTFMRENMGLYPTALEYV